MLHINSTLPKARTLKAASAKNSFVTLAPASPDFE